MQKKVFSGLSSGESHAEVWWSRSWNRSHEVVSIRSLRADLASKCWMEAGRAKPAPLAALAMVRTATLVAQSPRATLLYPSLAAILTSRAFRRDSVKSSCPVTSSTACAGPAGVSAGLVKSRAYCSFLNSASACNGGLSLYAFEFMVPEHALNACNVIPAAG